MGAWDIELCDCGRNPVMFIWACCVPCGHACMQGVDAKLMDPGNKSACFVAALLVCCFGCIGGVINRYKLRDQLKIKDSVLFDVLFWCFLPCCAVTQEYITVVKDRKGEEKMPIWQVWNG